MKPFQAEGGRDGNVALAFALLLPVLLGAAGAAIDFARYAKADAELQEIADAAALAGAREYLTSKNAANVAENRAEHVAESMLAGSAMIDASSVNAVADDKTTSVSVAAQFLYKPTLFIALFKSPLTVVAEATAQVSGGANICVIALDPDDSQALRLTGDAKLIGNECAVYSNSTNPKGLAVNNQAQLSSAFNCSAGGFDGAASQFSPEPLTDCPVRSDPLADRPEPSFGSCGQNNLKLKDYVGRIAPGVYCGGLNIDGDSDVEFDPGVYVFKDGPLTVANKARIHGDRVGLFFSGKNAAIRFSDESVISLAAPETGPMAGMLIWQSKTASGSRRFDIGSNHVDRLVGTIYLPTSDFYASVDDEVAEDSAYTAIIANRIHIEKFTELVLNTDYAATSVPVPAGIANAGGAVYLRE